MKGEGEGAPWLLYGAYGYTGRLLLEEAIRRGHRPTLAGRDPVRLEALRREVASGGLGGEVGSASGGAGEGDPHRVRGGVAAGVELPARSFPLDDPVALREGLAGVRAVLHAAGPFVQTGVPMMEGCLDAGVHYLDITGEVPVFEEAFARDARARARGVVLMPGVGLDVVPTDGVAALLVRALPGAARLELALHSTGRPSSGTVQTVLEGIPRGLRVRRGGRLIGASPGSREFRRRVDFGPEVVEGPLAGRLGGERWVSPYTWGDLSTAWRTTGIPDITVYMSSPRSRVRWLPVALPLLRGALSIGPLRRALRRRVARGPAGPGPEHRATARTRVWGRVEDAGGASAELVLEIPEGYRFTALAGIRALEEVLASGSDRAGTLTPAGAFGPEWVLALPGVEVVERRHTPRAG